MIVQSRFKKISITLIPGFHAIGSIYFYSFIAWKVWYLLKLTRDSKNTETKTLARVKSAVLPFEIARNIDETRR